MRLSVLEQGLRPLQKLQLAVMRRVIGRSPDPVTMMSYRRELFGKHLGEAFQASMRGSKEWTLAELEIFAAFVSKLNQCFY